MRDAPNSNLPSPHVLEALRRPRWLQQTILQLPAGDALWKARWSAPHVVCRGPAPSFAGNWRPEQDL
jgi:hypothetical protein